MNHEVEDYVMEHQFIINSLPTIDSFDDETDDDSESNYVRIDCKGTWVDEIPKKSKVCVINHLIS